MNSCFSKCDDFWFVVVGEVVECCNMLRGEHGEGIEGANEEVWGEGGTWVGLDVHTEKECSDEEWKMNWWVLWSWSGNYVVKWKLCKQEGVCLGRCMFVLRWIRVEDDEDNGPTCEWERRRNGSTDRRMMRRSGWGMVETQSSVSRWVGVPCSQLILLRVNYTLYNIQSCMPRW